MRHAAPAIHGKFLIAKEKLPLLVQTKSAVDERGWGAPHFARMGMLLLALAGCARAQVGEVATAAASGPTPVEILVDVSAAPAINAQQAAAAQAIGPQPEKSLVQTLTKQGVTAEPFVPNTEHPGAAVLHVAITQADPGNAVARFVIGFGAGRSELHVAADLERQGSAGAYVMTAFNTSSNSGRRPGVILPGGVALATGKIIHLAIGGGIEVATSIGGALDRPVRETATAIVHQMKDYYTASGWYWPASEHA
jgi:hypothetical protein